MGLVLEDTGIGLNKIFLLIFGWGGKTAINCFIFITGYYMCKTDITSKKWLKLFFEIEFYNIVVNGIFFISGYEKFSLTVLVKILLPIYNIDTGFPTAFLVFYLFIPFINMLIKAMNEKQHRALIILNLIVFTVFPTLLFTGSSIPYVFLFGDLYLISSYVRLYPKSIFENLKISGIFVSISLILSWVSVICSIWMVNLIWKPYYYHFVSDSNKILALTTAFSAFLFFKNLKIGYHKWINMAGASTFGVLMIHANSDAMRRWLWKDTLNNIGFYHSPYLILHALISVIAVYIICIAIDMLRLKFIERSLLSSAEKIFLNILNKINLM